MHWYERGRSISRTRFVINFERQCWQRHSEVPVTTRRPFITFHKWPARLVICPEPMTLPGTQAPMSRSAPVGALKPSTDSRSGFSTPPLLVCCSGKRGKFVIVPIQRLSELVVELAANASAGLCPSSRVVPNSIPTSVVRWDRRRRHERIYEVVLDDMQ